MSRARLDRRRRGVGGDWCMRYGSLCSGIGGLDLAVESVFDATPAWFCEADPHAASVLERHWPGVPIIPDLKTQDWTTVEPVELICAGYPCQPFSHAGARGGTDDPRHLWPFVADAVRVLRPRLVVLENVAGHLSLGFDRVLADLAALGFDAEWGVVRASEVGACHQRARLFVVATDASGGESERRRGPSPVARAVGAARLEGRGGDESGDAVVDRRAPSADRNGRGCEVGCEPDGGQVQPELISPRRCDIDRRGADAAHADYRPGERERARQEPRFRGQDVADAAHVGRQRGGASR